MKQPLSRKIDTELRGIDAALNRAAVQAKKLAEQQGIPYVTQSSMKQKHQSNSDPNTPRR